MKSFWAVCRKSLIGQLRDPLSLLLAVFTAPLFVMFYWLFFQQGTERIEILYLDEQRGAEALSTARKSPERDGVFSRLQKMTAGKSKSTDGADGKRIIWRRMADREELENRLREDRKRLGLIRHGPSTDKRGDTAEVFIIHGDAGQPHYATMAFTLYRLLDRLRQSPVSPPQAPGAKTGIRIIERPVGRSGALNAFDLFVPGLVVFAVIMLIFSTALTVSREIAAGTLDRLRLTPLPAPALLGGVSVVQLFQGVLSVTLTMLAAFLLGFRSEGSPLLALMAAIIACFSAVGIGILAASFARTVFHAFLFSAIAMFLLILFSGIILPLPQITIPLPGGHRPDPLLVLPTVHLSRALKEILHLGGGFAEIAGALFALGALSFFYFALGVIVFKRHQGGAAKATRDQR